MSPKPTAAAPIHPDLPTCKAEADDLGSGRRNQDSLHMLYASQAALQYGVPEPKYKQASLRNSTRSLKERRVEPLSNLKKVLTCQPRVAYALMHHMHEQVCTRMAISYLNLLFFHNTYHYHELYQGMAPPGLTSLTYRWRAKQGRKKTGHKRGERLCTRVYVLITQSHL